MNNEGRGNSFCYQEDCDFDRINTRNERLCSIEMGTAGKGGVVKVYFDPLDIENASDNPSEYLCYQADRKHNDGLQSFSADDISRIYSNFFEPIKVKIIDTPSPIIISDDEYFPPSIVHLINA